MSFSRKKRLYVALACYAVLALTGALTLVGFLRWGVICLLAVLAVKTLAHANRDEEM